MTRAELLALAERIDGMRDFLNGERALDGAWFGDDPLPKFKGARFWWRRAMRRDLADAASSLRALAEWDEDELAGNDDELPTAEDVRGILSKPPASPVSMDVEQVERLTDAIITWFENRTGFHIRAGHSDEDRNLLSTYIGGHWIEFRADKLAEHILSLIPQGRES